MFPKGKLPQKTRWQKFKTSNFLLKFRGILEKAYPWISGLAVLSLVWFFQTGAGKYEDLIKDVLPTVVSVTAILAGFQGTIHTILLSMRNSRIVKNLEESGHFNTLMSFVTSGVVSLLVFVVVAVIAMVCHSADLVPSNIAPSCVRSAAVWCIQLICLPTDGHAFVLALLAGIFTHSMLASFRIIHLVVKMVQLGKE